MRFLPYDLIRPLLFSMNPELAHDLTIRMLTYTQHNALSKIYRKERIEDPVTVAGITFPNRVGLAAGLDKNGECIDGLGLLGFGFVEAGTVTPQAQPGNPKPRMFRLVSANALINRCGFNNEGLDVFLTNIQRSQFRSTGGILGLNIGKNKNTSVEKAQDDYLLALEAVYAHADYVAINISSPNTPNLRDLQSDGALEELLAALSQKRMKLSEQYGWHVPLFVKIAPDLEENEIERIAGSLVRHHIDGVIATNTTLSRNLVAHLSYSNEAGGLSGAPLRSASTRVIRLLRKALGKGYPIIASGGVMSAHDAQEKIQAGADLVQIYTGLIYKGPDLVNEIAQALSENTPDFNEQDTQTPDHAGETDIELDVESETYEIDSESGIDIVAEEITNELTTEKPVQR